MAGLFFDYFPGYLRVVFAQELSYLHMHLHVTGDILVTTPCDDAFRKEEPQIDQRQDKLLPCWISDVWCAFPDLIAWLEAIVCGVQECAFQWDGEGPDGRLEWDRSSGGNGYLRASWHSKELVETRALLKKRQLVEAFYLTFRSFVESPKYDPLAYEDLRIGEIVELVVEDATAEQLAERLAILPRSAAHRLVEAIADFAYRRSHDACAPKQVSIAALEALANCAAAVASDPERWLSRQWDEYSVETRRCEIVQQVFRLAECHHSGSHLRALRSPIIEQWLSRTDATRS